MNDEPSSHRFRPRDHMLAFVMATGVYVVVEPAPFDVAILGVAVLLLLTRALHVPRTTTPAVGILFLFMMTNVISLVFSRDLTRSYIFLAVTAYLVLLWGIVVACQGAGRARASTALLHGYAIGGALASAAGVAAYLGAPIIGPIMAPDGRLHGLFKDPNVYGAYMVPVALVAMGVLIGQPHAKRLRWVAVLAVSTAAVFLSFSRGAWANFGVGVTVFFFLFTFADGLGRAWWRTVVLFPPVLLLLAIAAFQLLSVDAVSDMFSIRFGMQSYDNLRFEIQARATAVALQNPLGLGPGMTERTFTVAAHSTYVRALVEHGFLGLLSVLALMLTSAGRSVWMAVFATDLQDRLRFSVIAAALCGMAVESSVIDTIHWRHYWIFLGLAWAPTPRLKTASRLPLKNSRSAPARR